MTKELFCKLQMCDTTEQFSDLDQCQQSDWTELSPIGVNKGDVERIPAYCPGHSLDD